MGNTKSEEHDEREEAMSEVLYFAYGSNLDREQMAQRCPGSRLEGAAALPGHRLAFSGHSQRWGGGAATVVAAPGHSTPGLLWRLTSEHVLSLDGYENHPQVYGRIEIDVQATLNGDRGGVLPAMTYQMRTEGTGRAPSLRYLHQIWRAYHTHGLDVAHLLSAVEECLGTGPLSASAEPAG